MSKPRKRIKRSNRWWRQGKFQPAPPLSYRQEQINQLTNHQRKLWAKAGYSDSWLNEFFAKADDRKPVVTDAVYEII